MATRYEYYNTGDIGGQVVYGIYWRGQTFTPQITHELTSVKIKWYQYGTVSPYTITVRIREASAGLPIGADLDSAEVDPTTLPSTPGDWDEISLTGGITLQAGTQYAIILSLSGGDGSNCIVWRYDTASPTYTGGTYVSSSNSGSSWSQTSTLDNMFEEWGNLVTIGSSTFSVQPTGCNLQYRKPVKMTLSETGDSDYSVKIVAYKSTGSDSGEDVYLGENVEDTFNDIRFTKGDGVTLIPCWKESGELSSGVSCPYWVKAPKIGHSALTDYSGVGTEFDVTDGSLFAINDWVIVYDDQYPEGEIHQIAGVSSNTITLKTNLSISYSSTQNAVCAHVIFLYYCDSSLSDPSDGENTFIVFDSFDRGNDGDEVGGSWTEEQGQVEISTEQSFSSSRSMKLVGDTTMPIASIDVTPSDNIALRWRLYKLNVTAAHQISHTKVNDLMSVYVDADENVKYLDGSWIDTGSNITADAWQLMEINDFDWTAFTYDIYLNGSRIQDDATVYEDYGTESADEVHFRGHTVSGHDSYVDDFIVRKWLSTEPTPDWGSEQSYDEPAGGGFVNLHNLPNIKRVGGVNYSLIKKVNGVPRS